MAVNAGSADVVSPNGITYVGDGAFADGGFTRGSRDDRDITGTETDSLYTSDRTGSHKAGDFAYEVALENGTYLLELNFSEYYFGDAGRRVFDVFVEDEIVLKDLDIFDEAGQNAALDYVGSVTVADGSLSLTASASINQPKLSGFSIWATDETASPDFVLGSFAVDFMFV